MPPVPPSPVSENTLADFVVIEVKLHSQMTLIKAGGSMSKSRLTSPIDKHQQLRFHYRFLQNKNYILKFPQSTVVIYTTEWC